VAVVGACPTPRRIGRQALRCRSRKCPTCGQLWAGDTRTRVLVNVQAYGGDVALGTITAPGKEVVPDRAAIREWNLTAPERWTSLHRAARQAALRETGTAPTMVVWSWEYQRRGALHKHFILGLETARERAAAHAYMLALDRLRHQHGFGFVSDTRRSGKWRWAGPQVISKERASRYVAKYLAKRNEDGSLEVSETVTHHDVPPLVVYVSRRLTDCTGVTMRSLRRRRLVFVVSRTLGVDQEDAANLCEQGRAAELLARCRQPQGP
jgi:hypothetical protein